MFAAQAGAKRVYTVDSCSTTCHLTEKLIVCNGLQDRITVLNKRVEDIDRFEHRISLNPSSSIRLTPTWFVRRSRSVSFSTALHSLINTYASNRRPCAKTTSLRPTTRPSYVRHASGDDAALHSDSCRHRARVVTAVIMLGTPSIPSLVHAIAIAAS